MESADYHDMPLRLLLLAWARYKLSQLMSALRPRYSAGSVAALATESGQPPGA